MERVEELLRSARHAPAPTAAGLDDVTRRGRRRGRRTTALVAGGACLAVAAAGVVGTSLAGRRGAGVVTPIAASPTSPASPPKPEGSYVATQIRWHAAHVSADGRTVTVTFSGGSPHPQDPCYVPMRARAEETPESVTIRLETLVDTPSAPPAEPRLCLTRLYPRSETVVLDAPLGDRRAIDGVDGGVRAVVR